MSTGLSIFSRQEVDEQTFHNHSIGERSTEELLVCRRAGGKSLFELLEGVVGGARCRDSQEIGARSAVFLTGKMRGLGRRKALENSGKELRLRRGGQFMAQDEILHEQKIAHRGHHRSQQDGYATLPLVKELLDSFQRQRKVSFQD